MMEMLDYISKLKGDFVVKIAISLVSHLNVCLVAEKRHVLSSEALSAVCSAFHRLHNSQDILQAWTAFVTNISSAYCKEQQLTLQILLDHIMKKRRQEHKQRRNQQCH